MVVQRVLDAGAHANEVVKLYGSTKVANVASARRWIVAEYYAESEVISGYLLDDGRSRHGGVISRLRRGVH